MIAPTLAQRLALVKWFTDRLAELRKDDLVPDAQNGWPPGTKIPIWFAGGHAGWASMPAPTTSVVVADPEKFLAWAQETAPARVVQKRTIDPEWMPKVLAHLAEHLPDALETAAAVDDYFTADVCKALKERGRWADGNGEPHTEIPGLEVRQSDPSPRVNLGDDAGELILAAIAAGELRVAEALALPAPPAVEIVDEPVSEPAS